MGTEVRHGPHPRFKAKLQRGRFGLTIQNHYTHTPGVNAGGVTRFAFNSKRPVKRQAELLGLRTVFLVWWMEQWGKAGGAWAPGVRHITGYPWRRLRRQLKGKRRR